jgi:hypothetical protein
VPALIGPRQIPGLRFYFRSTDLGLGLVTTWTDIVSGYAFTQATASAKPTKNAVGVLFNTHVLTGSITVAGSYTLFMVFGLTVAQGAGTYGSMFSTSSSDGLFTLGTNVTRYLGSDKFIAANLPMGVMNDITYVSSDTTSNSYLNGIYNAFPNAGDASVTFSYMGSDNSNEYFKGYFCEIALWPYHLTGTEIASLHEYRMIAYPTTF